MESDLCSCARTNCILQIEKVKTELSAWPRELDERCFLTMTFFPAELVLDLQSDIESKMKELNATYLIRGSTLQKVQILMKIVSCQLKMKIPTQMW